MEKLLLAISKIANSKAAIVAMFIIAVGAVLECDRRETSGTDANVKIGFDFDSVRM